MMTALMFKTYPDVPLVLGFVVAIGIGAALGFINGLTVIVFRLPAIIVTLGTLYLYRGLTFIASGAKQIDRQYIPGPLKAMSANAPNYWLPWIVVIAIVVVLITYWFANHSRLGRQVYALGSNPSAAPLRGIPVTAVTLTVFSISGALGRARRHHVREPLGLRESVEHRLGFRVPGDRGGRHRRRVNQWRRRLGARCRARCVAARLRLGRAAVAGHSRARYRAPSTASSSSWRWSSTRLVRERGIKALTEARGVRA